MVSCKSDILLIGYTSELLNGEALYVSSNSSPIKAVNLEAAGHAFHVAALKLLGIDEPEDVESDDRSVSSDDKSQDYSSFSETYKSKGKKKADGSQQQDHYALLGLGHLRFLATEEQIRRSYRDMALKHHPDKQAALILAEENEEAKQAKKDEIETHFKAIQEAYEVLIDPTKRRIFDSTDEFDDEVPTDCSPQDFFKVFGLAFMRNGRWSVTQPIPSLGDDLTPFEEVDKFYNFWYSFKSWREFPHADEYDVEEAESREHKRWMERQNSKLQEKAKKLEYARIRTLVENAYKRDPRILRRREEEKAEKQRKKEARYLAKKLQEEEAARAAEEEKQRKEEESKRMAEAALNQKKQKEKEKKALRKERNRLRTLAAAVFSKPGLNVSEDDVEALCSSLEIEQMKDLCDSMEGKSEEDKSRLLKVLMKRDCSEDQQNGSSNGIANHTPQSNAVREQVLNISLSSYERKETPWGKDEIEMLRKGMQKYPKGTSRRWEVISEYIGTGRSVDEILKATKTVLLQKPDSSKAFDSFLERRKPVQSIESPLSTRAEDLASATSENVSPPQAAASSSNGMKEQRPDTVVASNAAAATLDPESWSETQELALVQALKTFPKDVNQRWERVAAAVPGKNVVQCKKKFALMKENFRSKKSGA